jgi:hypothetical protein
LDEICNLLVKSGSGIKPLIGANLSVDTSKVGSSQQTHGVGMIFDPGENIFHRAGFNDFTSIQHSHLVADLGNDPQIMG